MNKITLKIIITLLVFATSLIVYIIMLKSVESECSRVHLDVDLRLWGTHNAVPDEKTAIKIAEIALNAQSIGPLPNIEYEIEVTFYEEHNIWEVYYYPGASTYGGKVVYIRKDCGMISGMAYL